MKKIISYVLALSISFTALSLLSITSASASSITEQGSYYVERITPTTQEDMDKRVQFSVQEILNKTQASENISRDVNNPDHWRYEYGTPVYKTVSGYAGNQLPGGYSFPSGGSLFYDPSSGPDVSFSLSINGEIFSSSINIGEYRPEGGSITGMSVNIPADKNYYKIWVEKTVKVTPFTSYNWDDFNKVWVKYYSSYDKVEYSYRAYPVKQ